MAFNLVGFAPGYINAPSISPPAGNAGGIMFVGIGNSLVILFPKLVFIGIRIRIATAPELFNKALPLFVGNDVRDVFLQPVLVSFLEFRLYVARLFRRVLTLILFLLLRQAGRHGKSKS